MIVVRESLRVYNLVLRSKDSSSLQRLRDRLSTSAAFVLELSSGTCRAPTTHDVLGDEGVIVGLPSLDALVEVVVPEERLELLASAQTVDGSIFAEILPRIPEALVRRMSAIAWSNHDADDLEVLTDEVGRRVLEGGGNEG